MLSLWLFLIFAVVVDDSKIGVVVTKIPLCLAYTLMRTRIYFFGRKRGLNAQNWLSKFFKKIFLFIFLFLFIVFWTFVDVISIMGIS